MPDEINVAMAVFVLPCNSALNPFLYIYTFNLVMERERERDRDRERKRDREREKLMKNDF